MGILIVAGGHAPPVLEPAEAPFHGVTRFVRFLVVELGVPASTLGRNDGLDGLWCQLGAEGVAVIGPVRDQVGRAGLGFD